VLALGRGLIDGQHHGLVEDMAHRPSSLPHPTVMVDTSTPSLDTLSRYLSIDQRIVRCVDRKSIIRRWRHPSRHFCLKISPIIALMFFPPTSALDFGFGFGVCVCSGPCFPSCTRSRVSIRSTTYVHVRSIER